MKKIVLALMLLPAVVWAHPGHNGDAGSEGYSLYHFIGSQQHWLPLAGVALLTGIVLWAMNRQHDKKTN
ncbi:MAG: hypothetical protein ABR95_13345 [Sphingobacteriales bacterium BACL12 MAG-120813-bin55]|jgi:hypothetical protein|nr:MAG: hypothetical protein ABR94_08120 [Sphingobacteriales bacterium BACL12 MAG-120802-bin5]KRP07074.1 MAG: hypothetical protein ABR95_13345 [Sphingobacteriales bacterium BACL12 MAG-120813-bin55]